MRSVQGLLALSLLLAGCPIAPNNYGNDGGTADAGSTADAGTTVTPDAGPPSGNMGCSVSAQDNLGTPYVGQNYWSAADLVDSVATSNDGVTYNVLLEGSNTSSGTFSMEIDGLVVGNPTGFGVSSISYTPGSSFGLSDSWTCTVGGACGANVTVSSFNGQTVVGAFTVQFQQGASQSGSSYCSLSSGTFNVTIPQ